MQGSQGEGRPLLLNQPVTESHGVAENSTLKPNYGKMTWIGKPDGMLSILVGPDYGGMAMTWFLTVSETEFSKPETPFIIRH